MPRQSLKSILAVVVDPHRSQQLALAKAGAIAERSGARVTLFNSFMVPAAPSGRTLSSREVLQATLDERTQRLHRLAQPLQRKGVATQCVVEWDFPSHEAIVRQVLKLQPDLVVIESHHHNPVARMLLANTDWELIRACPCPVWFVRSRSLPSSPKLLVAVDPTHAHAKPSKLDDRLLAAAQLVAARLDGSVSMAHVSPRDLSSASTIMEPIRWPMPSSRAAIAATSKRAFDQLATRYSIKPANRVLQSGDAIDVLPGLAKKVGAHVLVMGAVSRSRLQQPFIGNTAEKVIDHVDCDVLVVKPANFKTTVKRRRVKL